MSTFVQRGKYKVIGCARSGKKQTFKAVWQTLPESATQPGGLGADSRSIQVDDMN